jgi:hypothetical protein
LDVESSLTANWCTRTFPQTLPVPLECLRGLLSGLLFSGDRWAAVSALRIYGDLTNIAANMESLGKLIGEAELERISELLLVQVSVWEVSHTHSQRGSLPVEPSLH